MEKKENEQTENGENNKNSAIPKKDGFQRDIDNKNNAKDVLNKETVHKPRDNA